MKTIFLAVCLCLSGALCAAQEKAAGPEDGRLMACVKEGDAGCVALALAGGASANAVDERGVPALALASEGAGEGVVRLLLDAGAEVNGGRAGGSIPLCRAALFGREETAKLLIAAGAKINVECDGDHGGTPLTDALMVAALIDVAGGEVGGGEGGESRHASKGTRESFLAIARLLVERGADVNVVAKCGVGETALMYAAMDANVEMVGLLLAHGAKVNNGGPVLAQLREEGYEKEKAKWLAMPALAKEQSAMLAWFERTKAEREKIRQLLKAAGGKEPEDDGGGDDGPQAETFEQVADEIFTSAILKSDAEDLERLVKAYASHPLGAKVLAGALRTALNYNRAELVELLLARGADPNAADDDGRTAREVIEFLKDGGKQD